MENNIIAMQEHCKTQLLVRQVILYSALNNLYTFLSVINLNTNSTVKNIYDKIDTWKKKGKFENKGHVERGDGSYDSTSLFNITYAYI